MPLSPTDAKAAADLLAKAKRILCICHRGPDGDAIGAVVGMGLLLEQAFPNIPVGMHCVDAVPDTFLYLSAAKRITPAPVLATGDVAVFLDCGEPKMTEMQTTH